MSQLKLTADGGGGTVAIKAPASTTGNAAIELTVPGTSNSTLATTATAGKILQVVQAVKTDTSSTNSATFSDISGLSVSITPTSASNKILVTCNLFVSGVENSFAGFKVLRGSTAIGLGTGASGNRTNVSMASSAINASSSAYSLTNASFEFLDSPSSTSSLTYKVQFGSLFNSVNTYINRPHVISEDRAMEMYTSSQITVMEVAA